MRFSLLITGAPVSSNAPATALRFARSAISNGHQIHRVFLQGDGVLCANSLCVPPQDMINIHSQWAAFAEEHNLDVVVCIASALKRGILDADEAKRYNKTGHNLSPSMTLSGLGQLIDSINQSDRLITFGG